MLIYKEPYNIDILKRMRETLGITQTEISNALGYVASTCISNFESHKQNMNRRQLMAYENIIRSVAESRGIHMKELEESVGLASKIERSPDWGNKIRSW